MESNKNVVTCKDCLWFDKCGQDKICKHIHFNEEYFEQEVLPRLRENIVPRQERKLSRKSIAQPGVVYDYENTLDYFVVQLINDTLKEIRHGRVAYIFTLNQVEMILSFEPTANIELHDGIFYVSM
jgi:hypothetical protein